MQGLTSNLLGLTCIFKHFFILIPINIKVLLILHTKFQPNIPSHFDVMDLNALADINFFRVDVYFKILRVDENF